MWIITAKCNFCLAEKTLEFDSDVPPYLIGEQIETCPCGGKYVVETILETD